MKQRLWKLFWLPSAATAIVLAVTACGDQGPLPSEPALSPESAQFARGGGKVTRAPKAMGTTEDGLPGQWTLAVGKLDGRHRGLKSEALVDGTQDVVISTAGHYLWIPKGAVSEPTTFRIRQENHTLADGSVVVGVDLSATRLDAVTGEEINVGALGFGTDASGQPRKVHLFLTYDWTTNRPAGVDPSDYTVLWLKSVTSDSGATDLGGDGTVYLAEEVAGVYQTKWFVAAGLEHFSRYALAFP